MPHPSTCLCLLFLACASAAFASGAPVATPSLPVCEACQLEPSATIGMAADFLASLDAKQHTKAQMQWDSSERVRWQFLPMAFRKGLPLADMTPAQQRKVWGLLGSLLSPDALGQARMTLDREAKLAVLEKNTKRDPARYFLTFFGKPTDAQKWGFSFEGHHLSLNFTFDKGQLVAATPMFFGASPATVAKDVKAQTPRATMYQDQDLALIVFYKTLTPAQQVKAQLPIKVAQKASKGGSAQVQLPVEPVGLSAAEMTPVQRTALQALIGAQVGKAQRQFANGVMAQVMKEEPAKQFFAWHGEAKVGGVHACLIQTGMVCVFLDAQAGYGPPKANHLHTMWRTVGKDF